MNKYLFLIPFLLFSLTCKSQDCDNLHAVINTNFGNRGETVKIEFDYGREIKSVDFSGVSANFEIASIKTSCNTALIVVPDKARYGSNTIYFNHTIKIAEFNILDPTKTQNLTEDVSPIKTASLVYSDKNKQNITKQPINKVIRNNIEDGLDLPIDPPVYTPQITAKNPTVNLPPPIFPTPTSITPPINPPTIYGKPIYSPKSSIMYVIDISGSMGWDVNSYVDLRGFTIEGHRLDRAKVELYKSLQSLPKNFKFNIIAFDCGISQFRSELVLATDYEKQNAYGFVRGLEPQGATGTGPAVSLALKTKNCDLIILLTDGAPTCDPDENTKNHIEAHRQMIRRANTNRMIINVYGISAIGEFKQFCLNVAGDSGGTYTDIK